MHTNGYSLARDILFKKMRLKLTAKLPGFRHSLGEELLRTHKNYQPALSKVGFGRMHALAHITGGGLIDNLPRVLPKSCGAVIDTKSWRVPPIFELLAKHGRVPPEEMYQVFNMGIGMIVIVASRDAAEVARKLKAKQIGVVEAGRGITRLVF